MNVLSATIQSGSGDLPSPLRSPEEIAPYLADESKVTAATARGVYLPRTVDELRAILHAVPGTLAVSGARTGLTGACVPDADTTIISLSRLSGIVGLHQGNCPEITILPGTSLAEINAYLAEHHPTLHFPVDPTETSASVGGMVATNAGGARSYFYGSIRPWVSALQVELPSNATLSLRRGEIRAAHGELVLQDGADERVLRSATIPKPQTKNTLGYSFSPDIDAVDLFIGAEGTLGIVSQVSLRLASRPAHRLSLLAFFAMSEQAFQFVEAVRGSALPTVAIEFLDERAIELAQTSTRRSENRIFEQARGQTAGVFVELVTDDLSLFETLDEQIAEYLGDATTTVVGTDDRTLREIKEFRHAVPEAINRTIAERKRTFPQLHKIATDMAVPNEHLAWVFQLYRDTLIAEHLDFAIFGHIGNNHFHVNILPKDVDELTRAKKVYLRWAKEIVARGGAVSAEHGIGRLKKDFLKIQYSAEVLETMRTIRRFFDPQLRLNPGVLIDFS